MNVDERLQEICVDYWFDPDYFGETIQYTPHGGDPRTVRCQLQEDSRMALDDIDMTETLMEQVLVNCMVSEADGIALPKKREPVMVSARRDPERRPYHFAGEIREKHLHTWVLVFERASRKSHGVSK